MRSKDRGKLAQQDLERQYRDAKEPGYWVFRLLAQTDQLLWRLGLEVKEVDVFKEQMQWLRSQHMRFVADVLLATRVSSAIDQGLRALGLRDVRLDDITKEFIRELIRLRQDGHTTEQAAQVLRCQLLEKAYRQESAA